MERLYLYVRYNLMGWLPKGTSKYVLGCLFVVVMIIFSDPISNAVGEVGRTEWAQEVKAKSLNMKMLLFWGGRYFSFSNSEEIVEPEKRLPGTIDGLTAEGQVLIRLYADKKIYQITSHLADLKIVDPVGAARHVNMHKKQPVTVDYYRSATDEIDDYAVVVWLRNGVPLNELLIEAEVAIAVETPPTNIVNRLMYQYYKRLVLGE